MLKKILILLIDCLLHLGFFSPLCMLPGYLPLLVVILYPLILYLERKIFHCTLGEALLNQKFVIYPNLKTVWKKSLFVRPKITNRLRAFLKVFLPIASFLTFVLAEPSDSFSSSKSNAPVATIEELHCAVMQPAEGRIEKGVFKLPKNGGNLPYLLYKMENKDAKMQYVVQKSKLHSEWTHYPNSLIMKGAVYVVMEDVALDTVHKKETGSHQGFRSTTIHGIKKGEYHLMRVILVKNEIYKVEVTYSQDHPEQEAQAKEFIDSFTPA